MTKSPTKRDRRRGAALMLCLFALLLVSALGLLMILETGTANRVNANYSSSLSAYYAARAGAEEVRDRMNYPSSPNPPAGGLGNLLPQDIAGNPQGVLYVLNPANGEVVDPTDPTSRYFDDQLCHDYDSGIPAGTKCSSVPVTSGWAMPAQAAIAPASGPLAYKWVRVNMKTNRIAAPYYVDQTGTTAPLDTRVCWDGQTEQLSPGGLQPGCDANGMQNVYMLTALGTIPGLGEAAARRLLRFEMVAPSIRPAAAVTISGPSSVLSPVPALSAGAIPATAIDGRPHDLNGALSSNPRCAAVAAMATDSNRMTLELEKALNTLRFSIVEAANQSCNPDGSSIGENFCSPGLWWVRGTDIDPRFVTTGPAPAPVPTPTPNPRHRHHGSVNVGGTGSSTLTTTMAACNSSTPNCFANLNLASPELMGMSATYASHIPTVTLPANASAPFIGGLGNQADPALYQPSSQRVLADEIAALNALVTSTSSQENFFAVTSSTLRPNYGSTDKPAIVVINDSSLTLQNTTLSGYGVLVVPNNLQIDNSMLQWTGIVLVQSSSGQLSVNAGAGGFINGALMLQAGSNFSLQTSNAGANPFRVTYSCDAIDLAFQSLPFKIVSSSELTY